METTNFEEKDSAKTYEIQIDYKFNERGELIHKKTGRKLGVVDSIDFDLIGLYIIKFVQSALISCYNMKSLYIPNFNYVKSNLSLFYKRDSSQAQCKIFATNDFIQNPKCLLLIQGTGVVRAGIWSRSVCAKESLGLGSMIPYVERAINKGYSVLIFNPNERNDLTYERKKINKFKTMEDHCLYVYNNIIKENRNIKEIYIVAHSMGGECLIQILNHNKEDLVNSKIKKIAFTDSVHGDSYKILGKKCIQKLQDISRHFIASDKPLGKFIKNRELSYTGIDSFSAGHTKHEYTSGCAIEEVFKFFENIK